METAREKLKNLLIILLEAVSEPGVGVGLDAQKFRELVTAAGYDVTDLGSIIGWLQTQLQPQQLVSIQTIFTGEHDRGQGVRCLSEAERDFLTPDAFGYLLDLCAAGQISHLQMETLIHCASQVAELPLPRQEMDRLIDQVLFQVASRRASHHTANGRENVH